MPDVLHDGNFTAAVPVGARRFSYPFRMNGDRVTAMFEEEYWQKVETFMPFEFVTPHPDLRDFFLIAESEPDEFMAGLVRFTRTYSRVPTQQVEGSSILVALPEPTAASGAEGAFGIATMNMPTESVNYFNGGILGNGWYYGRGTAAYYRPLKNANAVSYVPNAFDPINVLTVHVENHGFTNSQAIVLIQGNINSTSPYGLWHGPTTQWHVINANYIMCQDSTNRVGLVTFAAPANRAAFGNGSRYVRCRRVTDFYLPGISPGITTFADIPLPADQSNSAEFIDALLAGSGDINVQVGELQRWKDSPIYQITRTVISVADLL